MSIHYLCITSKGGDGKYSLDKSTPVNFYSDKAGQFDKMTFKQFQNQPRTTPLCVCQ